MSDPVDPTDPTDALVKAVSMIVVDLDRIGSLAKSTEATGRVLEPQESMAVARYAGVLMDIAKEKRDAEKANKKGAENMTVEQIVKKLRRHQVVKDLMDRDETDEKPARRAGRHNVDE